MQIQNIDRNISNSFGAGQLILTGVDFVPKESAKVSRQIANVFSTPYGEDILAGLESKDVDVFINSKMNGNVKVLLGLGRDGSSDSNYISPVYDADSSNANQFSVELSREEVKAAAEYLDKNNAGLVASTHKSIEKINNFIKTIAEYSARKKDFKINEINRQKYMEKYESDILNVGRKKISLEKFLSSVIQKNAEFTGAEQAAIVRNIVLEI